MFVSSVNYNKRSFHIIGHTHTHTHSSNDLEAHEIQFYEKVKINKAKLSLHKICKTAKKNVYCSDL